MISTHSAVNNTDSLYLLNSDASFPAITFKTRLLAIASAFLGSFARTWFRAASASSTRPRWISATAWDIRLEFEEVDGACASSSNT